MFLQVPGGVFSQKIGGKIILVGGMFITSVFTLLTPLIVEKGGYAGFIGVRVIEGLAEVCFNLFSTYFIYVIN